MCDILKQVFLSTYAFVWRENCMWKLVREGMKNSIFLLFFIGFSAQAELILFDQIEAVIADVEGTEVVTKSDIERPSLGGGFRTKEDLVFERLILIDAKKHKVPQDDEAVDAYLAQIQREHNLSPEELESIFTSSGYTIEEGRQQLQMMQTVNTMLDVKIRSNLIVPRKDVEAYYDEHSEIIEATYTLERLFVPFSKKMSKKEQYDILCRYANNEIKVKGVEWSEPFVVNHSEISEEKSFIYVLEVGQISLPQKMRGGFELFKLIAKTPEHKKTLEESYREITDILRRPKYEELMRNYRDALFQKASIVYF